MWRGFKAKGQFKGATTDRTRSRWKQILGRFSKPIFSLISTLHFIPKETNMHYKTIMLELIQEYPEIHNRLRCNRVLLPTLSVFAYQLKMIHEAWKDTLCQKTPGCKRHQVAGEALELAIMEVRDQLQMASASKKDLPDSTPAVMVFTRNRTPRE
jgi:hypothetical protein